MDFTNQVAIVTGGGSGIGRATALLLAELGADIAIWDVSRESSEAAALAVNTFGSEALAVPLDITDSAQVEQALATTLDRFEAVDVLINCAGITNPSRFLDTSEALFDREIAVNLKGTFLCSKAVGQHMAKRRRGRIVNVASLLAHVGSPLLGAYAASKGGILAMSRVMAVELAEYKVAVNVVSPGQTRTPINDPLVETAPEIVGRDRSRKIPLGRINEAEDVARAIAFLASPLAGMITGQALAVDGGSLATHSAYVWDWEADLMSRA